MRFEIPYYLQNKTLLYIAIPCSLLLLAFIVFMITRTISRHIKKRYTNLVLNNSIRLNAIEHLNAEYDFYYDLKYEYKEYWSVNSKQKYDRFDFRQNLKKEISYRMDYFLRLCDKAIKNNDLYKAYIHDVNQLPGYANKDDTFLKHCNYKRYLQYEHKICESHILVPVTELAIKCMVEYISPAGRNRYSDYEYYFTRQIKELINEIYEDRERRETAAYQRSLMTESLRYDVLKRDNFRCVICGRSASSGVELHVDHIRPVSKGGKTVMSNLRTLCSDCNKGKAAKYDEYGLN